MTQILLPEPYQLKFSEWAALVSEQMVASGFSILPPLNEVDWQTWVRGFVGAPELVAKNVPLPDGYSDWRPWAHQFLESLL